MDRITKEQLEDLYINQGLSTRQCAEKLGWPTNGGMSWWLKKFGIKARPQLQIDKFHGRPREINKQIVFCDVCGKDLERFPSQIHDKIFCGDSCYGKWREENFKGASNPNFGNDKMAGANNPSWKGGISFEPYPTTWTFRLREAIRDRDGRICHICGKKEDGTRLDVHHVDYDKRNIDPDNLISLCVPCHRRTNYGRDQWVNFFNFTQYFNQPLLLTGTDN